MLLAFTNVAFGISPASMAASAAGWIGSAGWPTTIAGTVIARRRFDDGATRPKNSPCTTAAIESACWSIVSSTIPVQNGTIPRGMGRVTRRSPLTVNGRNRAANINGAKARIPASTALSSTGISTIRPRTRSGARSATSRLTLAPREVPPMTAWSAPRWSSSATTCSAKALIE